MTTYLNELPGVVPAWQARQTLKVKGVGRVLRISADPRDLRVGITRQDDDTNALREARYPDADVYTYKSNDQSAYKKWSATDPRVREDFERLISDVDAGKIQAVITYACDRLHRDMIDAERLLQACQRAGVVVVTIVDGEYDLATLEGRDRFRKKAADARGESERISTRVSDGVVTNKRHGKNHGVVAYGYRRVQTFNDRGVKVDWDDVPDDVTAPIVRGMYADLIAGKNLTAIANGLNDAGIPKPTGGEWRGWNVRAVIMRAGNAGRLSWRGEIVGSTKSEGLVSGATYDAALAILDKNASFNPGGKVQSLLAGIMTCAKCGAVVWARTLKNKPPYYACSKGFCVFAPRVDIDALIRAVVVKRLSEPDAAKAFIVDDSDAIAAQAELTRLEAKRARIIERDSDGDYTRAEFLEQITPVRADIAAVQTRLNRHDDARFIVVRDVIGRKTLARDMGDGPNAFPLDKQRAIVKACFESISVAPQGVGRRGAFDRDTLQAKWTGEQ